jgi:hypothetical protein
VRLPLLARANKVGGVALISARDVIRESDPQEAEGDDRRNGA